LIPCCRCEEIKDVGSRKRKAYIFMNNIVSIAVGGRKFVLDATALEFFCFSIPWQDPNKPSIVKEKARRNNPYIESFCEEEFLAGLICEKLNKIIPNVINEAPSHSFLEYEFFSTSRPIIITGISLLDFASVTVG